MGTTTNNTNTTSATARAKKLRGLAAAFAELAHTRLGSTYVGVTELGEGGGIVFADVVAHDGLGVWAFSRNDDGRAALYAEIDAEMRERGCSFVDTAIFPDDPNAGNTLVMLWASATAKQVGNDLEALRAAFERRGKHAVGMTFA